MLRPMTLDDLDDVLFVQQQGAQTGLANIFPQDQYPFPLERVRARWEEEVTDPGIDCFVVLDDRDAIAGFVAMRGDEFLHFGTAVWSWGNGLAGSAHDQVLGRWRARGCERAWLRVFEDNVRARRFYERRGWVPTGERSRSGFAPPSRVAHLPARSPRRPSAPR